MCSLYILDDIDYLRLNIFNSHSSVIHSILNELITLVLNVCSGTDLVAREVEVARMPKVLDMRVWDHVIPAFV